MTDGIAGLVFVNDMIKLLGDKWRPGQVPKPEITAVWKKKAIGVGSKTFNQLIITLDSENAQIFSLLQGDATDNTAFTYDWLHDITISLDIRTSVSEEHVLKLVNEAMYILKHNVVPVINSHSYIQVIPEAITSLNEQYRGLYRYMISVNALRFNP